jgi:iron complex transport system ATP-binding protein
MVKLSVSKLNFSYGSSFSLKDISFSINKGQICAILGPNASGKTTLIKCIAGVLSKGSGVISFDDGDADGLTERDLSRMLAYVHRYGYGSYGQESVHRLLFNA